MTFGEIYTRVCRKVWGSSTVPTDMAAMLQGVDGIIADAHRKIQVDYNYWFMRASDTIDVIASTQEYSLPTDIKEIISLLFKTESEDFYQPELSPLGLDEAYKGFLQSNSTTAEYPQYYEILNNSIMLYPMPSAARTLYCKYWQFLDRPATLTFTTDYDDLTTYGYDAIVCLAVSEVKLMQDEFQAANYWKQKAIEEMDLLKTEDRRRRQTGAMYVKPDELFT